MSRVDIGIVAVLGDRITRGAQSCTGAIFRGNKRIFGFKDGEAAMDAI